MRCPHCLREVLPDVDCERCGTLAYVDAIEEAVIILTRCNKAIDYFVSRPPQRAALQEKILILKAELKALVEEDRR